MRSQSWYALTEPGTELLVALLPLLESLYPLRLVLVVPMLGLIALHLALRRHAFFSHTSTVLLTLVSLCLSSPSYPPAMPTLTVDTWFNCCCCSSRGSIVRRFFPQSGRTGISAKSRSYSCR